METKNLEQVKKLINEMDDYSREGPPPEEQVRQMRYLTGIDWTAEELWQHCFACTSRASLEETAYLMFHKLCKAIHSRWIRAFRMASWTAVRG